MPMKNPPHPGDFIRTEIIESARLSVTAAAAALQVSRPALSSLLNGKADRPAIWRCASRRLSG
jgi:antitoxin HigA-1